MGDFYIVVGKSVVSTSSGEPRKFTRRKAKNFIRNQCAETFEKAEIVDDISGFTKRIRINPKPPGI